MKKLTVAEEELMKYLWEIGPCYFGDLKDKYPEPKPATTTINTLIKRLIDKKYIRYKLNGHSRKYYAMIKKERYFSTHVKGLISNYFNNSIEQFASFFTRELEISDEDLKKLKKVVDEKIKSNPND
ncbi:BlaI/MecI/CopY family transcriptional regulator [Winogradskyella sp.]|uniref:BlaI/MecI/CopY family transcriptional regulator n=1 Tax=Winogradskyella sp. TaxID=1883156 RepID=UPI00322D6178